jgi:hypothetical protein
MDRWKWPSSDDRKDRRLAGAENALAFFAILSSYKHLNFYETMRIRAGSAEGFGFEPVNSAALLLYTRERERLRQNRGGHIPLKHLADSNGFRYNKIDP